ncbi:MAG: LPS export ABC transporter periplasmic protein LptC [Neisseriaceae bacterium]|nr:LPS export ABC transporter periplasmic protein LptC [Neisseriaceae bacterium]
MKHANRVYPLILMFFLAGTTFYLEILTKNEVIKVNDGVKKEPDWHAETAKIKRFDEQGQLLYVITAKKAWQNQNSPDLFFESPRLEKYSTGQLVFILTAPSGRFNDKSNQAWFDDSVTLNQLESATQVAANLLGKAVTLDLTTHIASSKEKVDFLYGLNTGHAIAFMYDSTKKFLRLQDEVHLVHVPEKAVEAKTEPLPLVLETTELDLDMLNDTVKTDQHAKFTQGDSVGITDGLVYHQKTQILNLLKNVKVHYAAIP